MHLCTLNTGAKLPRIGLGTYEAQHGEVEPAIQHAIRVGYRHFDLAAIYGNEKECGAAFSEIFESGSVKREDIWVTSKLWTTDFRPEHVLPACQRTLADLQFDYLDLYLIHWPIALKHQETPIHDPSKPISFERVSVHQTWAAMEELVEKGLVKNIGVSNFPVVLLHDLCASCKIRPVVNQVELHPYCQQPQLVDYCTKMGIALVAYSPLARVGVKGCGTENLFSERVLVKLSQKHRKSPAQICLRWQLQRSPLMVVIPKSTKEARIGENFAVFDFALDDCDMKEMTTLEKHIRCCDPIVLFGVPLFS